MKVLSTDGLTKLIQLIKSTFIPKTDTEQVSELDTVLTSEVTLATVATTGDYNDLINKPSVLTIDSALSLTSENAVQNKVITEAISDLSANVNIDSYLDMIISGNQTTLPIISSGKYDSDLNNIIGGTYGNL